MAFGALEWQDLSWPGVRSRGVAAIEEIGADEGFEVAVEDFLDIAALDLGAVILDHLVRLHHVGADLTAEADVGFGGVELALVAPALFELELVEARAQHLHGGLAVLVLAAFVLALDDDAGGQVREANGGVDLVDVLASMAAGAEGVNAQILGLHLDVDAVIDLRDHVDGRERRVAV